MNLPNDLSSCIESIIYDIGYTQLKDDFKNISERYRNNHPSGENLLKSEKEIMAYSVARMPGTYGAVLSSLKYSLELSELEIKSLVDCGAGTGAATWAANTLLSLENITCLEREEAIMKIGKKLMEKSNIKNVQWINLNLIDEEIPEGDLIIASYVLNEMNEQNRIKAIGKLWNKTKKMLLIVEPGTKIGYEQILENRKRLIDLGANILAPCPHMGTCKLEEGSWCHFSCRIPRSKNHRLIKNGDAPFEDEKFTYIAAVKDESKEKCKSAEFRIMRHPLIGKGHVSLDVCTQKGVDKIIISKKDKELYKVARGAKWGDALYVRAEDF